MRKRVVLIALLFMLSTPCWAAWTLAQSNSSYPGNITSGGSTLAFVSNVTSGNLIVVAVMGYNDPGTITVSKSAGTATIGSWTSVTKNGTPGHTARTQMFWCLVTGTGSMTVQVAFSSTQDGGWHQHEFHTDLSSPTITAETGAGTAENTNVAASSLTSSGVTTTADGGLMVSICGSETADIFPASMTGENGSTSEAAHYSKMSYDLDVGTAGSKTAAWSFANGTYRIVHMMAFKAVAGGARRRNAIVIP